MVWNIRDSFVQQSGKTHSAFCTNAFNQNTKTMKNLLSLIFILTLAASAQAQMGPGGSRPPQGDGNGRPRTETATNFEMPTAKGNSKISGFVVDSALTQAVEYATVALIDKATQKTVDGTIADDKGKFALTKVAEGEYSLLFRFIGYSPKTIDDIKVEKGKDIDLGVVKMSVNTVMLDAVTVTGEKSLIEEKWTAWFIMPRKT